MAGKTGPVATGDEVRAKVVDSAMGDYLVVSQAGPPIASQPWTGRVATDYINTTHPDTGVDVVFVPGESIPEWATTAAE